MSEDVSERMLEGMSEGSSEKMSEKGRQKECDNVRKRLMSGTEHCTYTIAVGDKGEEEGEKGGGEDNSHKI